ncbi:hypothetical protein M430DRAFT_170686 [Amorphotheca resinae ATCC 22711]|jgi:hypothetical protein|uniref:Uncharacterized protein n=1 Tax=Amorphotheca resinae ATCC 22711 TaxID=857342 RepID=A0A2T3AUT2_AMORE|nr:hypothetical protein M430DRAFT_170686 [Amorphotheca resinae ATCC 22711]PSS12414.1 hypothetical protein M430DRAFT_170686 [Amorphotheca resinae ATCC 22711]
MYDGDRRILSSSPHALVLVPTDAQDCCCSPAALSPFVLHLLRIACLLGSRHIIPCHCRCSNCVETTNQRPTLCLLPHPIGYQLSDRQTAATLLEQGIRGKQHRRRIKDFFPREDLSNLLFFRLIFLRWKIYICIYLFSCSDCCICLFYFPSFCNPIRNSTQVRNRNLGLFSSLTFFTVVPIACTHITLQSIPAFTLLLASN